MPSQDIAALHHQAILAYQRGNLTESLTLLQQALALDPENILLLKALGQIAREAGDPLRALDAFLHALTLDLNDATIWNAAGVCYQETGNPAKALEYYLRALTLRPDLAEIHSNIGVVLLREGNIDAATDHLKQAITLDPASPNAWLNLALTFRERLEYPRAIDTFRTAQTLSPNNPNVAGGLGEILSLTYNLDAEPTLRHALALDPQHPERHWNLALDLLRHGHYLEGFRGYEGRFRRGPDHTPPRPFPQPLWLNQPSQNISGKTLLLHAEQGFGDTLQMLRYLPLLQATGANIVLEVQAPLVPLVAQYGLPVFARDEPLPPFDFHASLMSLPHLFRTTLETIPAPLRLTPAVSRPANKTLRIGLAWSGSPSHLRDRERSIPLDALAPLFAIPHCTWVSLQTGPPTQQIQALNLPIEQPQLHTFADTAALLDTLDLVLAVDTAVAHLAATQGIPTWILLPYVADWRWLTPPTHIPATTPNPWYPQARIFRQTAFPHTPDTRTLWQPVLTAVAEALQQLATQQLPSADR